MTWKLRSRTGIDPIQFSKPPQDPSIPILPRGPFQIVELQTYRGQTLNDTDWLVPPEDVSEPWEQMTNREWRAIAEEE